MVRKIENQVCSEYSQTESLKGRIQITGVDAVEVVNNESVALFSSDALTELLQRPFRRRMTGHVAVQNLASRMLDDEETVEQLERNRRHGEKSNTTITSR